MEIAGILRGIPFNLKEDMFIIAFSVVFFLIGLINHRKYRALRRVCKELLDGKNVEKIDYMIKDHKFYKGGDYYILEYYIEGKPFTMKATKMDCRNNKNNEYYLRPVYDRKGRVREFVVYMDKKNLQNKVFNYLDDLEQYKEMQRLKEEKNEKAIRPKPKLKHVKDNTATTKAQEVAINKIRKKTSRKMRKQSELEQKK
ncbi:hypothetical protein [Clostridium felsineum]|uniref:hypothetical protein n=1 Tax=Clostridium felsineum TaxID=36839 RepID=UPI00098BEC6D|nr:hypothetical protein [Clostridium felsineum]URZ15204.1 hypothetical protein CLFE_012220 [Clostridium felsineum DSM 794]